MDKWSKPDAIRLQFPVDHDNMPIKGFPIKYKLINGWTIPNSDIKYLTNGPLVSEDLRKIIVQHNIGIK